MSSTKFARTTFTDDQIGRRYRGARRRRIARDNNLAMAEMECEEGRGIWVYAADPGADISEKTPANSGGQPAADLRDLKSC